jgi:hypothetical protein
VRSIEGRSGPPRRAQRGLQVTPVAISMRPIYGPPHVEREASRTQRMTQLGSRASGYGGVSSQKP